MGLFQQRGGLLDTTAQAPGQEPHASRDNGLQRARHVAPRQLVEASAPPVPDPRFEERDLFRAQAPACRSAVVKDMLLGVPLGNGDNPFLAQAPVEHDLCRRLSRYSRKVANDVAGVAVADAFETAGKRAIG